MKKGLFYALCLGALAMSASCQKTEQNSTEKGNSVVFTAQFDNEKNVDVRTVLDETGKKSLWNKDEIRVLNGENMEGSAQVYATMAENAMSATFTIKDASASFTGTHFIAACPAAVAGDAWWNGSVDKTINKLWLKPEQTAVAGGYDPEAHIAVAYTEGTDLLFKNACALLYFTVKGDNVSEVVVYSNAPAENAEEFLSGNFSFNTETQTVTTPSGENLSRKNYVKVVAAEGTYLENGTTYYMPCLPTTLSAGFTLEVVSDGVKGVDKKYGSEIEFKRNERIDLGDVSYTEKTRTIYLTPGPWNVDGARFAAYVFNDKGENSWFDFSKVGNSEVYKVEFSEKWSSLVLCRMKGTTTENDWPNKDNQTEDILFSGLASGHNHFTITDWGPYGGKSPYTTSVYTE